MSGKEILPAAPQQFKVAGILVVGAKWQTAENFIKQPMVSLIPPALPRGVELFNVLNHITSFPTLNLGHLKQMTDSIAIL